MHYLLSNDDGYQATGLRLLAEALKKNGDVTVIAPESDQSGVSHSLTLSAPVRARTADNNFIYINGTPADCIHLAMTGLLPEQPDMVISGINAGANLGDDVLYSGTVAAAVEARFMNCPAIAVSLAGSPAEYFDTAVSVILKIIKALPLLSVGPGLLLNINVPDLPLNQITGFEVSRLGSRHQSKPAIKSQDPRGLPIYWIGAVGKGRDIGVGTDFHAIANNKVSITPLQTDLTKYSILKNISQWADQIPD